MHNKLSRLIEPNLQPYFLCLALFALVTATVQPWLAGFEGAAVIVLYVLYRRQSRKRRRSVMQYLETMTGGMDSISKNRTETTLRTEEG